MVLAGKGGAKRISAETQRRVQEAAAALQYAPSLLHQSVRRGRTRILAFYSGFRTREPEDIYINRLSAAIEASGGRHRYNILAYCDYEQTPQETFDFLNGGFVDGVVLVAARARDPLTELLRKSGPPTVVIDPVGTEPVLPAILTDDRVGMASLADALVHYGHSNIVGFTPDWPDFDIGHRRYDLLRQLMKERGVEVPDRRIGMKFEPPMELLEQVLAMTDRPTALHVWHDRFAYSLVEACHAKGVRVPEELSIVGYDGIIWPSKTAHVVTSISAAPELLAEAAISLLVRLVEGAPAPHHETVSVAYAPGTTLGPARPVTP